MFKGTYTALVTPFINGNIDYESFEKIIHFQMKNNVTGIVVSGSTGEAATLTEEEQKNLIKTAVDTTGGKIKIIVGTGTNSTAKAIKLTKTASEFDIDGVLVVSPYYNKPSQEGLLAHYREISKNTDKNIILYNVPGRTGSNICVDTVVRLSEIKNIVCIKEASGNIAQMQEIIARTPEDFTLLSGDDPLTHPIMSVGGTGVISVTSNVMPAKVSEMVSSFLSGNLAKSLELHRSLLKFHDAMFIDTNPVPVKQALSDMGFCSNELRLPLVPMNENTLSKFRQLIKTLI